MLHECHKAVRFRHEFTYIVHFRSISIPRRRGGAATLAGLVPPRPEGYDGHGGRLGAGASLDADALP